MIVIEESGMKFGEFPEEILFRIENSPLHISFGRGIKTVEFLLLKKKELLLFVEAKASCPNAANKDETEEKNQKFREYYDDITDKFSDSLQMLLTVILSRSSQTEGIGSSIREKKDFSNTEIIFALVIKNAEDEEWLAGPKEELEKRLLRLRRLWNAKVVVLNEELAKEYGLMTDMNKIETHGEEKTR